MIPDSISSPINLEEGDFFDQESADRAINFIEKYCSHVKGKEGRFLLEDWQKGDIIAPLFGWKKSDGRRKYRTCYIEIPRKNGKSNLSAAIALYMLFGDGEKGAEIISAAGDRNQARIVYDIAAGMVRQSRSLSKAGRVYQSEIRFQNSFYKSISAEARTKHGFNCSAVIFDELHTQPDPELWQVLTTSIAARSEPLIVALTTAGHDFSSICYEIHEYALKVRSGEIEDPTFLPVVYAADPEDDWKDPETWKKANPGFGSICREEYFRQQVLEAENAPSNIPKFKRLHLNIWTSSTSSWISDEEFMKGSKDLPSDEYLSTLPCFGGIDLAAHRDLTAFAMIFVENEEKFYLKVHQFVNEERASIKNSDGVDYFKFAEDGDLTITPGNVTDFDVVRDHVLEMASKYSIQSIAFDRKYSPYIISQLMDHGLNLAPFGQGYYEMNYPTKRMEMAFVNGEIIHSGNPCLRWQIGCARIDRDPADNIKVTKNRGKKGDQVDGVVASIMAFGEMLKETEFSTNFQVFTLQ